MRRALRWCLYVVMGYHVGMFLYIGGHAVYVAACAWSFRVY